MNQNNSTREPKGSPDGARPLEEEIARRAYAYWQAEGSQQDAHMRHWLRAEAEVLAERGLPLPVDENLASEHAYQQS